MNKHTHIALQFEKNDGFWSELVKIVDDPDPMSGETDQQVIAVIPVKSYTLEDHQFVQVKLAVMKGKETVVLIPRNIVKAIIEGKGDAGISGFYSAASKRK